MRVNTNNGLERQNKLFKYTYLKSHRNNSLSGMPTILIEEFLPDNYNRYAEFEINTCLITLHLISVNWCLKRVHSVSCQEAYCNSRISFKMAQMMLVTLKINCTT